MSPGIPFTDFFRTASSWFTSSLPEEQTPLRAELLNADQMALHAKALAGEHELNPSRTQDLLLKRLDANEQVLIGTCKLLMATLKARQRVAPSGEWQIGRASCRER